MNKPLVVILMGSSADLAHCKKIAQAAEEFGLATVSHIASAHKTADHALALLRQYEADPRAKVYITVAGRSNALSGFTDGAVSAPVIACPPPSDAFAGLDILSSLRMPSGIAPAVVLEPYNAALLAARILALADPSLLPQIKSLQQQQQQRILDDNDQLQQT